MPYPSVPRAFLDALDRRAPGEPIMLYKGSDRWEAISVAECLRRVAGVARALEELGVQVGDRVALFSANRPEWHIADMAIVGIGAVNVPIYFNESPERIVYILNDSGARVAFVAGTEQARRLLSCRAQMKSVEHVIVASAPEAGSDALCYEALIAAAGDADITSYRRRTASVSSDQLATIIYTSGTTGIPKGVMLTHSSLTSNAIDSSSAVDFSPNDVGLSFLPLAHVYERTVAYSYLFSGVQIAYVEKMESLPAALREVHPTLAAAVPRVFEKMYSNILAREHEVTGWRRRIYDWAMNVARRSVPWRAYGKPVPFTLRLQWYAANMLAFSKIRAGIGGRVRSFISGAAPLSRELLEFFWSVDIRVYQGYGQTETAPVIATNTPSANRVGSVGKPIPNVEVVIAADGEILVRGPCVMRGYYNKPDDTAEVLTPDGWLRTGDVGYLDADGYLYVTDRKKDLIKTAAGKYVAPQPIENTLKTSPYIANAVLLGDRRRFVSALIVPNFPAVERKAREINLTLSSPVEMAAHPWVRELIGSEISRLTPNLAQYETIKRFAILDHDFTVESGQITFTLKVRRRFVEERYAALIEQLYRDPEEPQAMQQR